MPMTILSCPKSTLKELTGEVRVLLRKLYFNSLFHNRYLTNYGEISPKLFLCLPINCVNEPSPKGLTFYYVEIVRGLGRIGVPTRTFNVGEAITNSNSLIYHYCLTIARRPAGIQTFRAGILITQLNTT